MAQRKAIQKPGLLSSPYLAKESEPPGGANPASAHGPGYGPEYEPGYGPGYEPGYGPGYGPRGELALIELIRKRAARIKPSAKGKAQIQMGIGDDCALLRPRAGHELAVTTDLSIEGRHFRLDWHPPESIGHRALARGLSDLAAMGARPVAAFLSLALPRDLTVQFEDLGWMERFLDGLLSLAARYNVPLAGGDLAESPLALADVVLTGSVPQGKALLRSGAKPGDLIYVTGSLGGSAAQLAAMSTPTFVTVDETGMNGMFTHGDEPHFYPEPRIAQGLWLRKRGVASAAMDISDGLSTDLAHLVKASAVAAEIVAERIPLGRNATLAMALHGGEDYELLFTAPAERKLPRKIAGVALTQIGRILPWKRKQPRVTLIGAEGSEALEPLGWEHFSDRA
jgi:thiamine-monophosphate kinase